MPASTERRRLTSRRRSFGTTAVAAGSAILVLVIVTALTLLNDHLSQATRALLLVVPVVAAAVLGSRWLSYVIALLATVAFTLSVPPLGAVSFAAIDDALALAVFFAVAVVVSTLVSSRIDNLAEVDEQRRLLLRSVSHDLRTPLATIKGAATELLEGEVYSDEDRRKMLRLVDREATRLDHLVANLLALGRIEAGAMVLHRRPTDLEELVNAATRRFVLGPSDVVLAVGVEPDLPLVDLDEIRIAQVIDNLVDNAIRHSPPAGTVDVRCRRIGQQIRIDVTDEGPGIPDDAKASMFEPFRSGAIPGTSGVGLAICRAVVEEHGGTIWVDDGDGRARISVMLPS